MENIAQLIVTAPYDFSSTIQTYTHNRTQTVDYVINNAYRRVLREPRSNDLLLIEVVNEGSTTTPKIILRVLYPSNGYYISSWLIDKVKFILGANLDLDFVYKLIADDPAINFIRKSLYGLHMLQTPSVFEAIICGITEQQISLSAALKLRMRLIEQFGNKLFYEGKDYYEFPSADQIANVDIETIRSLGFTQQKANTIKTISELVFNKEIDVEAFSELPIHEVIGQLTKVKGIGNWTAKYTLAKGLGNTQVYSMQDLALRREMEKHYGMNSFRSIRDAEKILDKYGEYSGYIAFCFIASYVRNTNMQLSIFDFK